MAIILHIGTHKTGTTAIQRFLERNRRALREAGIWYPHEAELLTGGEQRPHHLDLARSLDVTRHAKRYSPEQIAQITRAICSGAQQHQTTIISAEAFWRIGFGHPDPDGHNREHLWSIKKLNIQHIRQLFDGADVEISACLRDHANYIQSLYSEFLISTQYRGSIRQFETTYQHALSYHRQLSTWAKEFPVSVHSYEQLSTDGRLPLNFLQKVCRQENLATVVEHEDLRANRSDPIACIAIKRHLNQLDLPAERRQKIYCKVRKRWRRSDSRMIRTLREVNAWCTTAESEALAERFRRDDQQVREDYCPQLSDRWKDCDPQRARSIHPLRTRDERLAIGWCHRKFAHLFTLPAEPTTVTSTPPPASQP